MGRLACVEDRFAGWFQVLLAGLMVAVAPTPASAQGGITASGKVTADSLTISGLNCSASANGGALTADSSGNVSCSDDDVGGGGGGGTVLLLHGGATLNAASLTRYGFLHRENQNVLETTAFAIPRGGILKNMYVTPSAQIDPGSEVTVTILTGPNVAGLSATTLTVTIDNLDVTNVVSNTVNTASVSAGDLVVIRWVSNASFVGGSTYNVTFELEAP
ncbi:MAG TPA: hypothetical protein VEK15_24955 [Vicinamibacteria bacterium]|nr:hypothetical protein [Vicinamibacteria bacterium]